MFDRLSAFLWGLAPLEAALWIAAENAALFLGALAFGHLVIALCGRRWTHGAPDPVSAREALLAALCVGMNVAVTLLGWFLWKRGWIRVRPDSGWRAVVDFLILLSVMDAAMYVLHRLAHHRLLYPWLHAAHHRTERPRPLTLFVMHPLEAAGFGALWLGLLLLYSPTWAGMTAYLTVNVACGVLGHVGVDPFPRAWARLPLLGLLAGSRFHEDHHRNRERNLGFYSTVWDRLFGTISGA